MTTQIAPGDLVMRDGRAEEVTHISSGDATYWNGGPCWHAMRDATRIGSIRDGWRIHTGSERPEGVGAQDRVEVFLARGELGVAYHPDGNMAQEWDWDKPPSGFPGSRIVAYRIVSRATPPGELDNGRPQVSAGPVEITPHQPSASELQAVAAEIRKHADTWPHSTCAEPLPDYSRTYQGNDATPKLMRAWADKIDPKPVDPRVAVVMREVDGPWPVGEAEATAKRILAAIDNLERIP